MFQAVLSTDGVRSFAIFMYESLNSLPPYPSHQIGFNAGDGIRTSNIQPDSLENINVFRIDGTKL